MKKMRLYLDLEEFKQVQNKTISEFADRFVACEVADSLNESMRKALLSKMKVTLKRFLKAYFKMEKENIKISQYSLRKYEKISYPSSEKFLPIVDLIKSKIEAIKFCYGLDAVKNSKNIIIKEKMIFSWFDKDAKTIENFIHLKSFDDADLYFYYYEEIDIDSNEFDFLEGFL